MIIAIILNELTGNNYINDHFHQKMNISQHLKNEKNTVLTDRSTCVIFNVCLFEIDYLLYCFCESNYELLIWLPFNVFNV